MKTFLFLVLFLFCGQAICQSVNSPFSSDKQKHIYIGTGIGIAIAMATHQKSDSERILLGTGVGFGINLGKEIYDGITDREVEALDVVYGTLGAFLGSFITVKLNNTIRKRKRNKNL